MGKYNKEFIIPYYDCDKSGFARPVALLEYLVETSSIHSDSLGLGFKELIERDEGWVLSRWKVKLYTYPKARDKIKIETWTSGYKKFYAYREFKAYNEDGELLAKASTLWIFMDIERRRPTRISEGLYSSYSPVEEQNFDDFLKFTNEFREKSSMDFRVRKTDIDYNEHVNNAKYLNWFLELIPLNVDEDYYLSELDIYYKKEIKYNHMIESRISESKSIEDRLEFFHEIYNKDTDTLTTRARTVWKKS